MTFKSIAEFLDSKNAHAPTPAELRLIAATQAGEPCILSETRPTEPTDKTRIRAPLLRLLILGGTPECGLHESGVALVGGWIQGQLDLSFCTAKGQTVLVLCNFSQRLILFQSSLKLLNLRDSQFPGILGQGLAVSGSLFLRNANSIGCVDVNASRIGGQLSCDGAHFVGNGQSALNAQGAETAQDISLRGVTAYGMVSLSNSKIGVRNGGSLYCDDASLNGQGMRALDARGAEMGRDICLRGTIATGTIEISETTVNGNLIIELASLDGQGMPALRAFHTRVIQSLIFKSLKYVNGAVDLRSSFVGDLGELDASALKRSDQFLLEGIRFDLIAGSTTFAFSKHRSWLIAASVYGEDFHPQALTEFARTLRRMGNADEARKALIERTKLQGKYTRLARVVSLDGTYRTAFRSLLADLMNYSHYFLDRLSLGMAGYGHAPLRSVVWLLGLFLAAWVIAGNTWATGAFAPNSDVILTSPGWAAVTANDCLPESFEGCDPNPAQTWANTFTASSATPTQGADWESFSAPAYALDLVVPILDLGQTDAWAPSKDRGPWGWLLWWSRWAFEALGWLVSGLGIAAVTGVMQRNQPD